MSAQNKTRTLVVGDSATYRPVYENIGKDVYFYVSGSRGDKHNKLVKGSMDIDRRVAVFGGDVVISGSLRVEGGELAGSFDFDCDTLEITGSVEVEGTGRFTSGISTTDITTLNGDAFFVAGNGIALTSDPSSGQITIAQNIEWNERLSGIIDGENLTFMTAHMPASTTTIMVFLNGVLQESGAEADFTISGNTVTFNIAPPVGSKVTATYSR
jgi:hypothetical protein